MAKKMDRRGDSGLQCRACPHGKTTANVGSTTVDDCIYKFYSCSTSASVVKENLNLEQSFWGSFCEFTFCLAIAQYSIIIVLQFYRIIRHLTLIWKNDSTTEHLVMKGL